MEFAAHDVARGDSLINRDDFLHGPGESYSCRGDSCHDRDDSCHDRDDFCHDHDDFCHDRGDSCHDRGESDIGCRNSDVFRHENDIYHGESDVFHNDFNISRDRSYIVRRDFIQGCGDFIQGCGDFNIQIAASLMVFDETVKETGSREHGRAFSTPVREEFRTHQSHLRQPELQSSVQAAEPVANAPAQVDG